MRNIGSTHWTGWTSKKPVTSFDTASFADLWLRGGTWSLDGSNNVQTWTNMGTAGTPYSNAAQATAGNRPASTATQNGHPGAQGDGVSKNMDLTGPNMGAANTVVVVAGIAIGAQGGLLLSYTGSSGIASKFTFVDSGASFTWTSGPVTISAAATGVHMVSLTQTDGGNISVYLDGTLVTTTAAPSALATKTFLKLFERSGGDFPVNAPIYEVIHCPSVLSAPNLATLHAQTKAFWGL